MKGLAIQMQKSPYDILGIGTNATDEQIKEAYKILARRYQSDGYGTSSLSDIARRKMNELDEAYDEIMLSRRAGGANNSRYNEYSGNTYTETQSKYPDIRAKIYANRVDDAETLLDGILPDSRDAEWYYLKGLIAQQRGWFEEAERCFASACEMDGKNAEYASAYNKIYNKRSGGYRTARGRTGAPANGRQCSMCDICSGLLCLDCLCECMGVDCISCC